MNEVLREGNPLLIAIVGLMAAMGALGVIVFVFDTLINAWHILLGGSEYAECGWGWWANRNRDDGWCHRKQFHFGPHEWRNGKHPRPKKLRRC